MDTPTLDALQAQALAYTAEHFNGDDETAHRVLNILLGEPSNHNDPRQRVVSEAWAELTELLVTMQSIPAIEWTEQQRTAQLALEMTRMPDESGTGPQDEPWEMVANYLANLGDGYDHAITDLMMSDDDLDDLLGE